MSKPVEISKFLGKMNTVMPEKLPMGALTVTNNVMITDSGSMRVRKGITKIASATKITSSYGTLDNTKVFLTDSGTLYRFDNGGIRALATGANALSYQWTEESSNRVFMAGTGLYLMIDNGEDIKSLNVIKPVGVTAQIGVGDIVGDSIMIAAQYKNSAGLLGPMSDPISLNLSHSSVLVTVPALANHTAVVSVYTPVLGAWHVAGETSNFLILNSITDQAVATDEIYFDVESLPLSNLLKLGFYQSRVVAAIIETANLTRIQFSLPQQYHLFHTTDDRFEIPDQITDMAEVNGQLLMTGKLGVYVLTSDNRLLKLVNYGTPVGKPIEKIPEGGALIWTNRGVCTYPEFKNLTQKTVSLAPGSGCSTALVEQFGSQFLLICNDGTGTAFNKI